MPKINRKAFKKTCSEFLNGQKVIIEEEQKLKSLKTLQKDNINTIKQYMEENKHTELEIGGYLFQKEEVEKCSFTEKNLEEFLEDGNILDNYRATYTKSVEKFRMKRPKNKV
jgi:hypothetical protein